MWVLGRMLLLLLLLLLLGGGYRLEAWLMAWEFSWTGRRWLDVWLVAFDPSRIGMWLLLKLLLCIEVGGRMV